MKIPWMKFYPADWRSDPDLQLCSLSAKGLLIELMTLAHNGEPYGYINNGSRVVGIPVLARLTGESQEVIANLLSELISRGRIEKDNGNGYCVPRMVRDGETRELKRAIGSVGGNNKAANEKSRAAVEKILAESSDAFKAAWGEWRSDREARGEKMTWLAEKLGLLKCKAWGEDKSIKAIHVSIERGWRGLYEADAKSGGGQQQETAKPKGLSPEARYNADFNVAYNQLLNAKESENFDPEAVVNTLRALRDKYKDAPLYNGLNAVTEAYKAMKSKFGGQVNG